MKKILFIIWSYSLGGGAESLLTTIVNHLNPQRYQIGIIEFYHSEVRKERVNSNIKIYAPITFEGDKEYQKKLYYAYHEPEKMIRKYIPAEYDLYISFNYQVPSFLLPEGERNIAWIHGAVNDLAENGMEEYRYLQDRAFKKAARIVSISDITTSSIQRLFPTHADKIMEIYNALDIGEVREKATCITEIKLKHPAMICVGRLDDNKDPLRVLNIFSKVSKKIELAHLYFLGKGNLEKQIEENVKMYGLQERVHVLGYMENPFPVIKQADVCCMASKAEGFPLSLLESVALGVPFVSTEVGGVRLLSNGEQCGRIYTTDVQGMEAVLEILGSSKKLLELECQESISRFNLDNYIARIENLLEEILEKEITARGAVAWDGVEKMEELSDRGYYYRFPENIIPKNSRVILYGAGDIGTNYCNYIEETGFYQITSWVDVAAEKYRSIGKDVRNIETIFQVEYDVVLIAVMAEKTAKEIRRNLCQIGIPENKIMWARPIF